ncbi:MAG: SDR family NAD(P)-dependent oxidoreductase [Verrucomicrobia bacterium]|nr:SDR family NAD(P)-dependent oxidoreductase [Verrucomicrobiota bacterium]
MRKQRLLVTGGAGFIGANAAQRFLKEGWDVTVWDNLSRRGAQHNLEWLRGFGRFDFAKFDLRHEAAVAEHYRGRQFDLVLHCAGQVAVTTSIANPRDDFESNALGTFNLLEAIRQFDREACLLYASTNKVYGGLETVAVAERHDRYEYADLPHGIPETQPLDFHSPYGCSKGAADQYVRDYARIYGLRTVCFRQSCIYGCRQFGLEDQGWLAWFVIAQALGRPVTIYGNGKQTRDVLFIEDLIDAYQMAFAQRDKIAGRLYNLGGGPQNHLSLLALIRIVEAARQCKMETRFADWRQGDQKVFVADIRTACADFGWTPRHDCEAGVRKLIEWVDANLPILREVLSGKS